MKKKNGGEIIAGIDVGSHSLKMKIAYVNKDGKIKTLDNLRKAFYLGRDTFNTGKVTFNTVDEMCDTLRGFKRIMDGYGISKYRAVATTAIREAGNKEYIIDQIKLKTGLDVEVISNSEERYLTYKPIRERFDNYRKFRIEGALIADIGSGSSQISVYKDNNLVFSQSIKIGSLRIREMLSTLERKTLQFSKILDEYIDSKVNIFKKSISNNKISNFLAIGGEIIIISKLCNQTKDYNKLKYIDRDEFLNLYNELMTKSTNSIIKQYDVPQERADILLPSMIIFKKFLDMTASEGIYAPLVSLRDGVISDMVDEKFNTERNKEFTRDIVTSTKSLANRYNCDMKHIEFVEQKALEIYDELYDLHGLGQRERLLLQLASILHDIGKFINLSEHYKNSYKIIISSDIFGISDEELEMIANIANYHSEKVPSNSHQNYRKLKAKNRVIVSKLVSILRIADSLDMSHKQKLKDINIIRNNKELILSSRTVGNTLLEEWAFESKSTFFKEVFGITPKLNISR